MNPTVLKVAQILVIVLVSLGLDQWTKHLAQTRLAAARAGDYLHAVVLTVPPELDQKTVKDVLAAEFGEWNSEAELRDIAHGVTTSGAVRIPANRVLSAGDVIEVRHREIVIVPGEGGLGGAVLAENLAAPVTLEVVVLPHGATPGATEDPAPTPTTEPVEPTEPVGPTEPAEPTEPVGPTEPAEPTQPVEPTEAVTPEPFGVRLFLPLAHRGR